jgi:hypothetical protein
LKIEFGVPEEKCRLARRLAAMAQYVAWRTLQNITAVQLAYSIIAQAGPLANGKGAGFVVDQPQGEIEFLPVSRIAIV